MYKIDGKKSDKIDSITFAKLFMIEDDIEDILRNNIQMICDDEESMLIVGRQVKNEQLARSDLTAVDNEGNIVLIELKRDRQDIEKRKEAFEFQAIRYAASYATVESPDDLVKRVYAPYIEKHKSEFAHGDITSYELGIRKLNEFLEANEAETRFNRKQRVILVASDFDDQTLSAVAWLNSNNVDMSCYRLIPYIINDELYIDTEKILPVANPSDYYVNLMDTTLIATSKRKAGGTRRTLPRINDMLEWGVVKEGDIIVAKDKNDEGILLPNGNVNANGKEISLQTWLKDIYGWSSVQTYAFSVHKDSGKTLSQIREEYIKKKEKEDGGI